MSEGTEASKRQRQQCLAVARCMHFVPNTIHTQEARHLMNLLYETGLLSDYLIALDAADDDGFDENGREINFTNYFDFYRGYHIWFNPNNNKITHLTLKRNYRHYSNDNGTDNDVDTDDDGNDNDDEDDDSEEYVPIIVPSTIQYFERLESIRLLNCQSLTTELGNLPRLESIQLWECPRNIFENIPEGLKFPSIKKLLIGFSSKLGPSDLSSFLQIFPDTLEELCFQDSTREQAMEILHVLEDDDSLLFRRSLTILRIVDCNLNEIDLQLLLFEIRERFSNLHTLDIKHNNIGSVAGITDVINQVLPSSSVIAASNVNNLRKLNLFGNPVTDHLFHYDDTTTLLGTTKDLKEKACMVTLLDAFNGISDLGLYLYLGLGRGRCYDPVIENALRVNYAGRKRIGTSSPSLHRALWPSILGRAYTTSYTIYTFHDEASEQEKDRRKCATGLFDLVRHYWPYFSNTSTRSDDDDGNYNINNTNTQSSSDRNGLDHHLQQNKTGTLQNYKRKRNEMM